MLFMAACSIALALQLQPGMHIVEHSTFDDHVNWVLPPDKLEGFRRSGVVIDEDQRTTTVATTTVTPDLHHLMTLHGSLVKTSTDVPRHRTTHTLDDISTTVTPRNTDVPASRLDIEDSAMADLPVGPLCVGQTWRTRLPVMTTLGSGTATIDHTIVKTEGSVVEIAIKGEGVISGMEYNLPRLLPGAIGIVGDARFDRATGTVTSENYSVRNRLIRTVKGKTIGFLEFESVAITTSVSPAAGSRPVPDPRR